MSSSQINVTTEDRASSINAKQFVKLPPRNDKDESLCLNCSKYGHVSRYYLKSKKPKYTQCGKFGHEISTCTAKYIVTNDSSVVLMIRLTPNRVFE